MITIHHMEHGYQPEFTRLSADGTASFSVGEALTLSSGTVSKCAATSVPDYICVENYTGVSGASAYQLLVQPVSDDAIYVTSLSAAGSVTAGDKVTLSADGLNVTATTTSGVAKIVYIEGTTIGSEVHVKF